MSGQHLFRTAVNRKKRISTRRTSSPRVREDPAIRLSWTQGEGTVFVERMILKGRPHDAGKEVVPDTHSGSPPDKTLVIWRGRVLRRWRWSQLGNEWGRDCATHSPPGHTHAHTVRTYSPLLSTTPPSSLILTPVLSLL